MISPSDPNFVQPYTEGPKESNCKLREIKCIPCGYTIVSDLIGPFCGNCKRKMITVIKSQFDGIVDSRQTKQENN